MADEADQCENYSENMVEEGLHRIRTLMRFAPTRVCEDCGRAPHIFGNTCTARYCVNCLEERGYAL